jgi:hypothetical protein
MTQQAHPIASRRTFLRRAGDYGEGLHPHGCRPSRPLRGCGTGTQATVADAATTSQRNLRICSFIHPARSGRAKSRVASGMTPRRRGAPRGRYAPDHTPSLAFLFGSASGMEKSLLDRFRNTLGRHRDALLTWLGGPHAPEPLGSTNGARVAVVPEVLAAVDDALARIEHGTFGRCTWCDGEVETERLALDFTTCVCLDHYDAAQRRALERDLELAARVQQHLFPRGTPALPGFQIAAYAAPANIVGGDYYDFFCYRDQGQGLVVADVMGKGLAASMLMANLQASLRILGPEHDDLAALAARLNALFRYNLKLTHFVSLFLLGVDPALGAVHYCNAGHLPALWWRAASGTTTWLRPTGPALGLLHDPAYRVEVIRPRAGDVLVLYTDGLVEGRNADGAEYGMARLERFAEAHANDTAGAFLEALRGDLLRFTGGTQRDDLTLVVVKVEEDVRGVGSFPDDGPLR